MPESGSGTSKLLPGCLMLPSGTPPPLLAECWLHECLHTELYLAEWLSGQELATSNENLASPWRTINRSANLLLHGCFVFMNVVKFIRLANDYYASIEGPWYISATKGEIISVSDVQNVCNFRIQQVKVALEILRSKADFSPFGKIIFDRVYSEIFAL
jgi:HEXXH motif-containing protein